MDWKNELITKNLYAWKGQLRIAMPKIERIFFPEARQKMPSDRRGQNDEKCH